MKEKYQQWIDEWLREHGGGYLNNGCGQCRKASKEIAKAFPNLRVVRGYVHCPPPRDKRSHWWCEETSNGTIIDPTAKQFLRIFSYEKWKEGGDVLLGRCMNCGEEIWGPDTSVVYLTYFCSPECAEDARKGLINNGLRTF